MNPSTSASCTTASTASTTTATTVTFDHPSTNAKCKFKVNLNDANCHRGNLNSPSASAMSTTISTVTSATSTAATAAASVSVNSSSSDPLTGEMVKLSDPSCQSKLVKSSTKLKETSRRKRWLRLTVTSSSNSTNSSSNSNGKSKKSKVTINTVKGDNSHSITSPNESHSSGFKVKKVIYIGQNKNRKRNQHQHHLHQLHQHIHHHTGPRRRSSATLKLIKSNIAKSLKKGGIKSLPIKTLTHPLDRSITVAFIITLFFTLLAIVSGLPIVIILICLLPIGFLFKTFTSCYFKTFTGSFVSVLFSPSSNAVASTDATPDRRSKSKVDQHQQLISETGPGKSSSSNVKQISEQQHTSSSSSPGATASSPIKIVAADVATASNLTKCQLNDECDLNGSLNESTSIADVESSSASKLNVNDLSLGNNNTGLSSNNYPIVPVTPLESYWIASSDLINNNKFGICNVLLFMDKSLQLNQLKDIITSRVLIKSEFSKFTSILVYRGISRTPFWQRIPFEKVAIDHMIFSDIVITSQRHLKKRIIELSTRSLPSKYPLWQIRLLPAPYLNQIILLIRVHQSICDGVGLMSLLVSSIADSAPPSTTTFIRTCHGTMTATSSMFKPRFGGINFSLNICRAVVVGPLTFILWLWWAFTRRSYNYLISFSKSTQNTMYKKLIKSKCPNHSQCASRNVTPAPNSTSAFTTDPPVSTATAAATVTTTTTTTTTARVMTINQVSPAHQGESVASQLCPSEITSSHLTSAGGTSSDAFPAPPSLVTSPMADDQTVHGARASTTELSNSSASGVCVEDVTLLTADSTAAKVTMNSGTSNVTGGSGDVGCGCVAGSYKKGDSLSSGEATNEPLISGSGHCYKKSSSKGETFEPLKSLYWTSVELPKIYRIKQITRSCLNDVILAGISGAIREYLVVKAGVENPPDLTLSIPVDIRGLNDSESDLEGVGVSFVLLTSPLPTNTEGSIPRLWEIRHLMEELKASADPAVMYGAHYFLFNLLPNCISKFILNTIHRNSSVCVSNLQGPSIDLTIGTHKLNKIFYWMSTPSSIPITFNVTSYNQHLYIAISTTAILLPCAKSLGKLFKKHINLLANLLSKRRVPGEVRAKKRPHHVIIEAPIGSGKGVAAYVTSTTGKSSPTSSSVNYPSASPTTGASRKESLVSPTGSSSLNLSPSKAHISPYSCLATSNWSTGASMSELSERLHMIQMELNSINELLESNLISERDSYENRLFELKNEFSNLMKQIRRRKSLADAGTSILINISDDDDEYDEDDLLDGELRPARRRFSLASRRSSVVSSAIAFGTAAARRVSISPSTLASATASLLTGSSSGDRGGGGSSSTGLGSGGGIGGGGGGSGGGITMSTRSPRPSTSPEASSTPERKSSMGASSISTGGTTTYGTGAPSTSSYYREESSV